MKRRTFWGLLAFLIVISMVLASCKSSTTTSTPITATTTTASIATTTTSTTVITPTSTTSTAVVVTTAVTTTSTGNWWDSLGTPEYGGTMSTRLSNDILSFDPYLGTVLSPGFLPVMDRVFINAYATDPSLFDFSTGYLPPQYADGHMLTSYEMPNLTTFVENFRTDIYWQNIAPANGRQLVASDVVYHYDRMLGLGGGFTTLDPNYLGTVLAGSLISVTATSKYTVTFQFKTGTSPLLIENTLQTSGTALNSIESPDAVAAYTSPNNPAITNWAYEIGSGPFMLKDFVDNSAATFVANPNYWYYDERWPQNKLPYLHSIVELIIPNAATAEAAMRAGKIDSMFVLATDAAAMAATNPKIVQVPIPQANETTYNPRIDLKPFSDINVRIALQEAINMPLIAKTYYNGAASSDPMGLTSNVMGQQGWGDPYSNWPDALKTQYAFNPTNAKALLAAAGYPNGFNTDIQAASYVDTGLLQIVQSELASVGVNMSINIVVSSAYVTAIIGNHAETGLSTQTQGMLGYAQDPFSTLYHFTTGSSTNYTLVSDPKIDAWYTQAQGATTVDQVQQILHDESLYVAQQFYAVNISDPYQFLLRQPWMKGVSGDSGGLAVENMELGPYLYGDWIDQSVKNAP